MEKKLKSLGFKKMRGTEPGFQMFELTPARLQAFDENFSHKLQAASDKPQASSNKRLDKSK
jgi:hypothetical protein